MTETQFAPTRAAGLQRLEEFLPSAGEHYQSRRNFDLGPQDRTNVSTLSPYLTHRLVTESEVAQRVIASHKPREVESFLTELCWRTYWKGWLEGRPLLYSGWVRLLAEDSRRWPEREDYRRAIEGRTGIEPFDAWVKELLETGYLHNHARMWFASIWIFTLKLPWSLGAAFFLEHLLDGDIASNTLSWRWVAGLHTKGKHYLATASNIKKYTAGRFSAADLLVENAPPLSGPAHPNYVPPLDFPFKVSEQIGEQYAILLTGDDLCPELGALSDLKPRIVLKLRTQDLTTEWNPSEKVMGFKEQAINDAGRRAEDHFGVSAVDLVISGDPAGALAQVMSEHGLNALAYFEPMVGPWKDQVARLASRDVGVKFFPLRRPWDGLLHPHAVKGYFHFKKHVLPQVLRSKGNI